MIHASIAPYYVETVHIGVVVHRELFYYQPHHHLKQKVLELQNCKLEEGVDSYLLASLMLHNTIEFRDPKFEVM